MPVIICRNSEQYSSVAGGGENVAAGNLMHGEKSFDPAAFVAKALSDRHVRCKTTDKGLPGNPETKIPQTIAG